MQGNKNGHSPYWMDITFQPLLDNEYSRYFVLRLWYFEMSLCRGYDSVNEIDTMELSVDDAYLPSKQIGTVTPRRTILAIKSNIGIDFDVTCLYIAVQSFGYLYDEAAMFGYKGGAPLGCDTELS